MSNRAAYNFLSSISLGGNQAQKKEPTQTPPTQPQAQPPDKSHHSHREHFKAKLTNTLEKKHSILHKHDKSHPTTSAPTNSSIATSTTPSNSSNSNSNTSNSNTSNSNTSNSSTSSNSATATANKPVVHPNSLKRSTSNITLSNEYINHAVIRSTSGTSIQNRDYREPSPRDIKTSGSSQSSQESTGKPRNNSVDQGPAKPRDSGDYGIVRKSSDAGTTSTGMTKGRTGSTDQGPSKNSESSSALPSSSRSRGNSIEYSLRDSRRPSEPTAKLLESKTKNESLLMGGKDYRKLSKSTNDAGRGIPSVSIATAPTAQSNRSISTSNVFVAKRVDTPFKPHKEIYSSKEKIIARSQDKNLSPSKIGSKDHKSPLKPLLPNTEKPDTQQGPEKLKRQRRKKSKKSKTSESKRKLAAKDNPAALDFLKGISLGENTPTLRKRKGSGKSKLNEVYPQRNQDAQNKMSDAILFVGSSSTKKIKISDYSAQAVPGKLYLSTRTNSTFAVFSIIKYDAKASKKEKEKNALKESSISTIGKLKSVTNAPILTNPPKNETQEIEEKEYDPYFLDDPTLTTGKHRTVMNLPCFKESIIPYVRPGVIKDELNELFRQKHPWVPSGVTLHKIRKLKKALVLISVAGGLEVSTVAIAYALFEKLIMMGLVTKPQIRLYGAVCLILAAKANDPHGDELKLTVEAIEKQLDVEKKEVWEYEFPVFAAFSCSLLLPPDQVIPHIRLIFKDHQDLVGNPY